MDTLFLILFLIAILLIRIGYVAIWKLMVRRKFPTFIDFCKLYNYKFADYYDYKGKGLIYRKQISVSKMNIELRSLGINDSIIPSETQIFENLAVVEFPYWEEQLENTSVNILFCHGGIRFILFYNIVIEKEDKFVQRAYHIYIDHNGGEHLRANEPIDGYLFQRVISDNKQYALRQFVEKELKYWFPDKIH